MNVLFIDSGIGGITTLTSAIKKIPNLNFIYFADDKFSPYGNLSSQEIIARLKYIINSQLNNNIGLVVLACNTATANAIDTLRNYYNIPIIGTEPAIKPAQKKGNNVLVIATPSTINHKRFGKLIKNSSCNIEVIEMKNLAKQIDNYFLYGNQFCKEEIDKTIKDIALLAKNKTHIVLGCTHYVHLATLISSHSKARVLDGNYGVTKQIVKYITPSFCSKKPLQKFILSSKNDDLCKKYRKIFVQTLANEQNV